MAKYKVGDSLKLKSGSKCKTVEEVIINEQQVSYKCIFEDNEGKEIIYVYEEDLLIPCNNKVKISRMGSGFNQKLIDEEGFSIND